MTDHKAPKVLTIKRNKAPKAVIQLLRDELKTARSGEVQQVAVVTVLRGGETSWVSASAGGYRSHLVAALHMCASDVIDSIKGRRP